MSFYTQEQESDLVSQHMGLVTSLASILLTDADELEDYIQIGYIGLLKAIRKYEGYNAFSTMAWRYIFWEIQKSQKKKVVKTYTNFNCDSVIDESTPFQHYLPALKQEESHILNLRLSGYTYPEIGQNIGRSRYVARNKLVAVINKIKKANKI